MITALTNDQVIHMAEAMRVYGGGWAQAMGDAWSRADPGNRARLLAAFPELVVRYGPGSDFAQPADAPIERERRDFANEPDPDLTFYGRWTLP